MSMEKIVGLGAIFHRVAYPTVGYKYQSLKGHGDHFATWDLMKNPVIWSKKPSKKEGFSKIAGEGCIPLRYAAPSKY